ncbi:hypothetical protein C7S20_01610 [Christiangramia fulva]|uniref:Carboxypeptidase-like regulatory domain-containing protein n=1 Tax=Christiangramia fulva TaxID=2126553 RepID=A0A2R3Z1C4_9FLAO|nr:hypothetical protein [Christiangramia fulva]AVR44061.1 hypothetical protein C7S20_01610 [Christiangramia fulva]
MRDFITNYFIKHSFFLILLMFGSLVTNAQERQILKGKILSVDHENVEKINIINLNNETGTISDQNGDYELTVKAHDSILFSSVQFENKTLVVSEKMISDGKFPDVILNDAINELAEVQISNIKLSGYLANDINQVSIAEVETKNKLQRNLNKVIEIDRSLNPPQNVNPQGGINVMKVAGMIADKLNTHKETLIHFTPEDFVKKSISMVGVQYFRETLALEENEVTNFILYCSEEVRFKILFRKEDALGLIEYFDSKIDDFRNLRGDLLNQQKEVPL